MEEAGQVPGWAGENPRPEVIHAEAALLFLAQPRAVGTAFAYLLSDVSCLLDLHNPVQ